MEYKITEFNIPSFKTGLEQTTELPIEADFTIADYLEDIQKPLHCRFWPFVTAKQLVGRTVTVEGNLLIRVIYEDVSGMLCSAEFEQPFKKSFDCTEEIDTADCAVCCKPSSGNCRAVTERKLSVKGTLKLQITVQKLEENKILSNLECPDFELLKGQTQAVLPLGTAEKFAVVDDGFELLSEQPAIYKIVRVSSAIEVEDCKLLTGKAMISGNLNLSLVYSDKNCNIQKINRRFIFTQIVEAAFLTEECSCRLKGELCSLNLTTRTNAEGECRFVAVVARILLCCKATTVTQVPLLYDAYSMSQKAEFQTKEVRLTHLVKEVNESFLCKKKVTLPTLENGEVCDAWCESSGCVATQTEKGLQIKGSILCCSIHKKSEGGFTYSERYIDFEYPILVEQGNQPLFSQPEITVDECNFMPLKENELEVTLKLNIQADILATETVSVLAGVTVDEQAPVSQEGTAFIVYFAESGEDVWQICKAFRAKRQEFLEQNDLQDETLSTSKTLIIPRM